MATSKKSKSAKRSVSQTKKAAPKAKAPKAAVNKKNKVTTKAKSKTVAKPSKAVKGKKGAAEAVSKTGKPKRPPLSTKVMERKKSEAKPKKNRGLMIFGVIVGAVILLALFGKLRQGPPVKLLPITVEAKFTVGADKVGPLASPRGIGVDQAGNVFVADLGNHRVVKFGPQGKVVDVWGKAGNAAGEFKEPSGLTVDSQGDVYIADTWNGRIQKFSGKGEYYGEISSKTGNFYSPRNVAVDSKGFLYIADTGNSCVKKFDADANLVKRWGEYGNGRDRFQETFGIWLGPNDQVYVGDAGNRRIKVYTTDGKFVREIRVKGWQSGVGWPMMAVDKNGNIYATDVQHNMVWIYNKEGKYVGSWGNKPGKEIFVSPLGITVGPNGSVYVSNMNKGEIVKLAPVKQ
jgi:streptogramin lyase